LFDGGGLFLLVTPEGTRLWRLKYRYAGREKLLALGAYPQVSLRLARRRRDEARRLLEDGTDPSAKRKSDRAARVAAHENTFERIAREWLEKKSHRWDPGNAKIITGRLEADVFPWIGNEPIAGLGKESLLHVLERVERRGALETAHRIRQYIDSILRLRHGHRPRQGESDAAARCPGDAQAAPLRQHHGPERRRRSHAGDPLLSGEPHRAVRAQARAARVRASRRVAQSGME
jgi:hypothetical protein